jgi:hypothetical protein
MHVKPWSNESCGSNCSLPPTAPRGIYRCLDSDRFIEDVWTCNGKNCSDPDETFKLKSGLIQVSHQLRTELKWDGKESSAVKEVSMWLVIGIGIGLSVLLLAAVVVLVVLCKRLRSAGIAAKKTLDSKQSEASLLKEAPAGMPMHTYDPSPMNNLRPNDLGSPVWAPRGHELAEMGETASSTRRG